MINNEEKDYILHNSGIWGLYQFLSSYLKYGYKFEIKSQFIIELSSFYSQHIGFGRVRSKKLGKNNFLVFSQQCFKFIKIIKWSKIVIDYKEQRLYLVSQHISGDKDKWPDVAPFAISFYYENPDKLEDLKNVSQIDIKGYWFEDDQLIINHSNPIRLSVEARVEDEDIVSLESLDVESYFDLMTKQINQNINKYDNYIPEFKGNYLETPDHAELKKKGIYNEPEKK